MRRLISTLLGSCLMVGGVACSPNGGGGGSGDDSGVVTTSDGATTVQCDGGTITFQVDGPSCIWPPDHKMVLFTLDDVTATTTGNCALPTLKIIGVTSNQPESGGGSGNTSPDYSFNSTGVCLRAERDGTCKEARVYTITFEATDGNINVTNTVNVVVNHSQNGCANTDPSRVVADGDPRCN
jgi:hypothetical protein